MWHKLLASETEFYAQLVELDEKAAERVRAARCPCGGRLDRADYPRKPRGLPVEHEEAFSRRISFCCAQQGCRRRRTPPSVRFLGRRVYVAALVVACSAGWELAGPATAVPRRTRSRWRDYFQTGFVRSALWRAEKARLMPPVPSNELPAGLLSRLKGDRATVLVKALRFLSPITSESAGFLMAV